MNQISILLFLAAFSMFAVIGRPSRRSAWRAMTLFIAADFAINPFIDTVDPVLAASIVPVKDIVLAMVLFRIRTMFSTMQAIMVCLIGISGFTLSYDIILNTDFMYSKYELVIYTLYSMQFAIGCDGMAGRIKDYLASRPVVNRPGRSGGFALYALQEAKSLKKR